MIKASNNDITRVTTQKLNNLLPAVDADNDNIYKMGLTQLPYGVSTV